MNALVLGVLACMATVAVASVGPHGAVVSGPSGVVTSHGAIGPSGHANGYGIGHGIGYGIGHGIGYGLGGVGIVGHGIGVHHGGAVIVPPVATAVVSGPAIGHGIGVVPAIGYGYGIGHGIGVVTNGGGVVSAGHHGASVHGPPTAPAVIAGPSGKIAADGLWGPTTHWGHGGHGW